MGRVRFIQGIIMDFKNIFKTKKQKEEEARLVAEEQANKQRKKEEAEERRKAKAAEKKAAAEAKKNDAKALATAAGEPWVNVLGIEVDSENLGAGAFELDWNDIFVARLVKSGYQGKTDADIVDNWFQDVCRHVVMETYAQEQADPINRQTKRKDLGNGRTEIS
jgi:regulator of protease activity HflC (stomatin/prohibitin superfamily)